eukprot:superscaffoldBa00008185_g23148
MDRKQCCVKLTVQPSRGLVDEKFTVLVQNAPPGSQLTVHALHQCEDGHTWEAFAHYIANATGTVNGSPCPPFRPTTLIVGDSITRNIRFFNSTKHCLPGATILVILDMLPVSEDLSLGGTYSGVEPMGLLWSLRPIPGSKPWLRMRKMNVQTPLEIKISVYQGHPTEGFITQVPLNSVLVERWYMAPGIRRVPITEGRLTATLFLPSGV